MRWGFLWVVLSLFLSDLGDEAGFVTFLMERLAKDRDAKADIKALLVIYLSSNQMKSFFFVANNLLSS